MSFYNIIKGAIFLLVIGVCYTANAVDERITLQSFVQEIHNTNSHSSYFNSRAHLQKFATDKSTRDILYEVILDIHNTNSYSNSFYSRIYLSYFSEGMSTRDILISFITGWQNSNCPSNFYDRHNIKY